MRRAELHDSDGEFHRVTRSLQLKHQRADWVRVPPISNRSDDRTDGPGRMWSLRLAALAGAILAIGLLFIAFTVHPALGVVGLFVSPGLPLGLVVLADRIWGMRI